MHIIEFTKMVAAGNDFVVVDNLGDKLQETSYKLFAEKVCDRKYGIGADGMLLLEKTAKADIGMRIFNPDGSEAEMCGNGARCAAMYYAYTLSAIRYPLIKIETKAGILEAKIDGNMVKLNMSEPHSMRLGPKINFINTGVPHAVIFVDDLENTDVDKLGEEIRNSKEFAPKGTNVDFVKIIDKDTIAVRTYERGVEAETLACGTGAVASAIISGRHNVITAGKETLKVAFDKKNNKVSNVWLEGTAKIVYSGRMEL